MTAQFFIRRSVPLLAMFALTWALPRAAGQTAPTPKAEIVCPVDADTGQPLAMGRMVLGALTCRACHSQGTATQVDGAYSPFIPASVLSQAVHDNWVRGDEWITWSGDPRKPGSGDRHAQAFTTLLGERSRLIGKNLGIDEVHRDARCLACHSSLPAASLPRDGNLIDATYVASDRIDDRALLGVNCEACHGAAGKAAAAGDRGELAGWIDRHVAKQDWRYQASADKQTNFGFYDVRTPSSRAAMCLSCHLGDASQGRLVTHAMYAAGHPPLPSFELKAFADMMPAHWRDLGSDATDEPMQANPKSLRDKKPKTITAEFLENTTDPYFRNLREQQPDRKLFQRLVDDYQEACAGTRSMAMGALTAWIKNAELTRALMSDRDYPLLERDNRWPELSQFECSACHHELRQADWRQDENTGAPGRPMLRDWAAPLSRAVLKALAPGEAAEFDRRLREIAVAVAAQPYGDRPTVDDRLEESAAWLDGVGAAIESRPFGRAEALAVLRAIAAAGAERPLDYDAARQLVWAMSTSLDDLDPEQQWTAVRESLEPLKQRFVLELADVSVRNAKTQVAPPGASSVEIVEVDLSKVLPLQADHSGREVRKAFARVAEAAQADPP